MAANSSSEVKACPPSSRGTLEEAKCAERGPPPRRPAPPERGPQGSGVARAGSERGFVNEPLSSLQLTDQRAAIAPPTWSNEPLQ